MRPSRVTLCGLLVAPTVLTACSSGADEADAPGSSTSAAPGPSSRTTTALPDGNADAGCRASGDGVPAGADAAQTRDVDGDGQRDTEWIAAGPDPDGTVEFGITTASGSTFTNKIESAGPGSRSVLVADVTGSGQLIALASDGRQVLYALSRCQIVPMQNVQGGHYAFDLGFTGYGTGVGCVDDDGTRELAGVLDEGATISRTAVELDGPRATNGAKSSITATGNQARLAREVTCGELTLTGDGVTSRG